MVSEESRGRFIRTHVLLVITILVVIVFCLAGWLWHSKRGNQSGNMLPATTLHQVGGFTPYYLKPSFSSDFVLQQSTVKYEYGVLVFSLRNATGKTLSVTEETTPSQYDPSTLQTTKQFNTEYGRAYITDSTDRTTGTLFTSDKTWVIVNAASPVGSDFMQQFLEALAPVTQ